MNKKSIAFVCLGFNPPYGGNFIHSLLYLASKLLQYNIIFIFSQDAQKREWIKEINNKNFKILYINTKNNIIKQSLMLNKIIKDNDIVLIHSHFTSQFIPCIISRINRKVRVFMHNHSDWSGRMSKTKKVISYIKMNFIYHFMGRKITVMAVSKYIADKYKVLYVPNGLAVDRIKTYSISEIDSLKQKYNCSDSINILVFAWNPYIKGLDIAIDAVGLVRDKLPNLKFKLLIVCGENNIESTKKYIDEKCMYKSDSNYIEYLQPCSEPYKYYAISDIFVSSSRSEGFPYCLMEAISVGKPAIMSNIVGTTWAQEYGAVAFENEDKNDLAAKIENMIVSFDNLDKYRTNKDLLLKKLSIDNWAKDIIEIYKL